MAQVVAISVLALAQVLRLRDVPGAHRRHGLTAEANPIVVRIAESTGIPGLTLAKILTVALRHH